MPDKTLIKLTVLDPDMKIIKELENEVREPGTYEVEFDGAEVASGVFLYQLKVGSFIDTKKMMMMK